MKSIHAALAGLLLGCGAAQAATADALAVVQHHVASYKDANLEAVLSDYAPDAVVLTPSGMLSPNGVFSGASAVRQMFTLLTDKAHAPNNKKLEVTYEKITPDTIFMRTHDMKGTPQESSGHDVFVVRDGKIVFQAVYPDPKK